ncbi:MAG: MBL fold metallo-hydrolase [Clostridiales bacterium]|nr:MBL fold metallo-hydrolase [Clostridiales bacterium]
MDKLLYQGRASIRIVTRKERVIYVDPFAGDGYDLPADLILVTHEHFDHNAIDSIPSRNSGCRVIRSKDAISGNGYNKFDLGFAKIKPVPAGNNRNHSVKECVGYIIILESGVSIYVSGDTSTTSYMDDISKMDIDYAFYCCDGVYNMDIEEAIKVAQKVGAKHSIPYHITGEITDEFDMDRAKKFRVKGSLILEYGQEIELIK